MFEKYESHFNKAQEHFFNKEATEALKKPKMTFVFSSPGAGKTTNLKPFLENEAIKNNQNLVVLEIDEAKYFLPEELNKKNKDRLIDKWFDKFIEKAIEEKRSIVIFRLKNMLTPNKTLSIYKTAQNNGFDTEATFLAIDKKRSRAGMIYRYECALENYNKGNSAPHNYPRKPELLKHYIFFKATPIMLQKCIKSDAVHSVRVFDRESNLLAFDNKKTKNRSDIPPKIAFLKERSKKWNDKEIEEHIHKSNQIEKCMVGRNANVDEFWINNLAIRSNKVRH